MAGHGKGGMGRRDVIASGAAPVCNKLGRSNTGIDL